MNNNTIFYYHKEYTYKLNDIFFYYRNGKLHKDYISFIVIKSSYTVAENVYTMNQAKQIIKNMIENSIFK